MLHTRLLALTLAAASSLGASAGTVVLTQPWSDVPLMVASQAGFAKAFDNFSLAQATTLTDLHWTGNFQNPTQPPLTAFATDFLVEIWADDGGQPGSTPLYSAVLTEAVATPVTTAQPALLVFAYDADLPTAFAAAAGTSYWLSIQATTSWQDAGAQWMWGPGTGGDGKLYQQVLAFSDPPVRRDWDLAFSLTAASPAQVPEPAGLALAGAALLGALQGRRARAAGQAPSRRQA